MGFFAGGMRNVAELNFQEEKLGWCVALLSSALAVALGLWYVDVWMFINIPIVFEQIPWLCLKKTIGACFCILIFFFRTAKSSETKEAVLGFQPQIVLFPLISASKAGSLFSSG